MAQPDLQISRLWAYLREKPESMPRLLLSFCAATLFCSVIIAGFQPAATAELPFILAVAHWVLHIVFAMLIVTGIAAAAVLLGMRLIWAVGLAILFMPVALTPFSLAIETGMAYILGSQEQEYDSFLEELRRLAVPAIGLSSLLALFAFKVASYVANQRTSILARFAVEPQLRSVFPDIPHNIGDDLLSVSANDHYVHVRTARGTVMLSKNFSDCLEKLKPFRGLQVHRSHWVRIKHVDQIKVKGSSYICILSDGSAIPVSRRRHAKLKLIWRQ